ncbi:hypothetical protein KGQ24_01135 [Patescibacteria group bacterium]|nr:hypothetical protein [Patescibacteria group bacterium]
MNSAKTLLAIAAVVGLAALPNTTGPRREIAERTELHAAQLMTPQGAVGTTILPITFRGRIYVPLEVKGRMQVPVMLNDSKGDTTVVFAPLFDHHQPYGANTINVYIAPRGGRCCGVDSVTIVPSQGQPGTLSPPHFIYAA